MFINSFLMREYLPKSTFERLCLHVLSTSENKTTYRIIALEDFLPLLDFEISDGAINLLKINHSSQAKKYVANFRKSMVEKLIPRCDADSFVVSNYKMGIQGTLKVIGAILADAHLFSSGQYYLKEQAQTENKMHNYMYFGVFGASIVKEKYDVNQVIKQHGAVRYKVIAGLQDLTGYKAEDLVDKLKTGIAPMYNGGYIIPVDSVYDFKHMDFATYASLRELPEIKK